MSSMILVINCGSSSLKFALISTQTQQLVLSGLAEKLGLDEAQISFKQGETRHSIRLEQADHAAAMTALVATLRALGLLEQVAAIGHRVVHGGESFKASALIDAQVVAEIERCSRLAPLHNPAHLIGIRHAQASFPHVPHVAVFDTAFHQTMPEHAYLYAVPMDWYRDYGVRRYGFHGTSYRFVAREMARVLGKPLDEVGLVVAHLGNGASVAAIAQGQSVDTSMGLTPLEGLVMGTRSGDIDPGVFAYLEAESGMDTQQVTDALNKRSGLLGLSELSSDCRELLHASAEGHAGATRALEAFCYRLAKQLAGQMIAVGAGLDALVFTGGIGENSAQVRARTLEWLAPLGYAVDGVANEACVGEQGGRIYATNSRPVWVVNTNEEMMIALDTAKLAGLV